MPFLTFQEANIYKDRGELYTAHVGDRLLQVPWEGAKII